MRDLSLHILDLLENAVRAGAKTVRVTVAEDHNRGLLEVRVEDDGPGLGVPPEKAADPFYTTGDKRVGLGLSLFCNAAAEAEGTFEISRSDLGGTAVCASLQLNHVDRKPLGKLADSLFAIACTRPETELQCILRLDEQEFSFTRPRHEADATDVLATARRFATRIREVSKHLSA